MYVLGYSKSGSYETRGSGGGGGTDIRRGTTKLVVAGGGGGCTLTYGAITSYCYTYGGSGGGLVGGRGGSYYCNIDGGF